PAGRPRNSANRIPDAALAIPVRPLSSAYEERLRLTFFIAAAGTMTRAPTRTVPTILIPTATTTVTRNRYTKLTRATLTPVERASSSDRMLSTTRRYMSRETRTMGTEIPTERSASNRVTAGLTPTGG